MNNSDQTLVSVCIVTYNNERTIRDALTSLLNHVKMPLCVYVCDNASTDQTVSIVKEEFPTVTLLESNKNEGFSKGNNRVLESLESQYHIIMNPDILLQEDIITPMSEYLDKNPDTMMLMPRLLNPDGTEQYTPKRAPRLHYMLGGHLERFGGVFRKWRDEYTMKQKDLSKPTEIYFCGGCFMFIRTDIFRKIGGFDERYFLYNEDADLTRMVWEYGKVVYLPSVSVVHLWERAYKKDRRYVWIQIRSMIKYFWKWKGKPYGK